MKIRWDAKLQTQVVLHEAFRETMMLMGVEFTKAITSDIWGWPDGASRDIVDTGRLRDSYQLVINQPTVAQHIWSTEYAAAVHEGAVLKNGGMLTARPWTKIGLRDNDFAEVFARIVAQKMR